MINYKTTVIIAFSLIALCALFPPRRYNDNTLSVNYSTVPSRSFLWHPNLHIVSGGSGKKRVVIDSGKLLAEVVALLSIMGVALVVQRKD